MVNKISGRAYVHDGNHRIAALKRLSIEWLPVYVEYGGLYQDGIELFFPEVPNIFDINKWPVNATATILGFETKDVECKAVIV